MAATLEVRIEARVKRLWLFKAACRSAWLLGTLHLQRAGMALARLAWAAVRMEYRANGGSWKPLRKPTLELSLGSGMEEA